MVYSQQAVQDMAAVKQLDTLKALAEAASSLQCSAILEQAETALITNGVITVKELIPCSVWASKMELRRFEEHCAEVMCERRYDIDFSAHMHLPLVMVLRKSLNCSRY